MKGTQKTYAGDHLPSSEQRLLLAAALGTGEVAAAAWKSWANKVDFDRLNPTSVRMLPLLHWNLRLLGIEEGGRLLSRIGGVVKQGWARSAAARRALASIVPVVHEAAGYARLAGDPVLSDRYYTDPCARSIERAEVYVSPDKAAAALKGLRTSRWAPAMEIGAEYIKVAPGVVLRNPDAVVPVHLTWRLLQERPGSDADLLTREDGDYLRAADELIVLCVRGARWNWQGTCQWVADAVMLLRHEGARLDWNHLVSVSGRHSLCTPLAAALGYLDQEWKAPIPAHVHQRLRAEEDGPEAGRVFAARSSNYFKKPHAYFARLWYDYRDVVAAAQGNGAPLGFSAYLCHLWGLSSRCQLPGHLFWRGWRALRLVRRRM